MSGTLLAEIEDAIAIRDPRSAILTHFDRLCEAPGAVPRLRRFILDLAVRGKLVDQDPSDEPASELLSKIIFEKQRAVNAGEYRKPKERPPLPSADEPFALPKGWAWSQIAEVGWLNPRNDAPDGLDASFVPMPQIAAEYGVGNGHEVRPWREIKSGYTHFAEGDVGLAKITPCFENCKSTVFRNLTGGLGSGTTELHIVRPVLVLADYVVLFLKSPTFVEAGIPKMTGTAGQKRVPSEYFAYSHFPLPPLAEQRRIVTKVDELMALCDRLEATQAERERRRERLNAASLARLNAPTANPEAFRTHAAFHLAHLSRLTNHTDAVSSLREAILNQATKGNLVEQDPTDEPATEIVARTKLEGTQRRAAKFQEGNLIARQEIATLSIPPQWASIHLGNVCKLVTSGSRGWAEFYAVSGAKFVRAQNIRFGKALLDDLAFVNPPRSAEGSRTQVAKGDLIIVITGAGVTNPALIDRDLGEAYVSQHVGLVRPALPDLSGWLLLCLMAPAGGRGELINCAYGSGKPGLNLDNIRNLRIPLPPLAEQRRIVAKVDELMALCDRLESGLKATQAESRRLLDSLLHAALAE